MRGGGGGGGGGCHRGRYFILGHFVVGHIVRGMDKIPVDKIPWSKGSTKYWPFYGTGRTKCQSY